MKVCDTNNIILYFNYLCFFKSYIFCKYRKGDFSPLTTKNTIFAIGSTYEYIYIKHAYSHTIHLYVRYDSEHKHPLLS